jgi:hypothetical protein
MLPNEAEMSGVDVGLLGGLGIRWLASLGYTPLPLSLWILLVASWPCFPFVVGKVWGERIWVGMVGSKVEVRVEYKLRASTGATWGEG